MPVTPSEWLPVLAARMDAQTPRIAWLRRYIENDAPLPEMGANVRESWQRFQKQSRTNWAELITSALAERIIPNGVEVGDGHDSDLTSAAQRLWRDSRLDLVIPDCVASMLRYRVGYLTVWSDPGGARITADTPETMIVAADPLQPWRVRAALKWWRDSDAESDFAIVWCAIGWQLFSRVIWVNPAEAADRRIRHNRAAAGKWEAASEFHVTGAPPPVIPMENPDGCGEFELHTDIIDRINAGILERRVTSAMQAWRQRAAKGDLPEKDLEGNDIDWSAVFESAPGAVWNLPAGIDLWESQVTDIRPLLDGSRDDLRQLSAVSRTPLNSLIPDSQNQSATGAAATKESHILKAKKRVKVAEVAASAAIAQALIVDGFDVQDTVRTTFEPPEHVSLTEKYTAAQMAIAAGESRRSVQRNVLGSSPEQIAQDDQDRAEEALSLAALTGGSTPS